MFVHGFSPVLLHFGPFAIRYYGLFFAVGILFSYWLVGRLLKQRNVSLGKEGLAELAVYVVLGIVIGARLGSVLSEPGFYLAHPANVFALWNGGMAFHGGLAGALIAGWLFQRKHKVDFFSLADIVIIPIPLALALGRVGNFINGEFYGPVTSLPWGVQFPAAAGFRHPTQLYEAVLMLLLFAALWKLKGKALQKGTLLASFLLAYGVLRFAIEFLKDDVLDFGLLTWGQLWSIPMVVAGLWMLSRFLVVKAGSQGV